jgi:DUF1680 family protein
MIAIHVLLLTASFASAHHPWNTGDRVELDLPMTMRIEPIDPQHPQTVAVLFGPLVFAIRDAQPILTRAELLTASRSDQQTWQIKTASGPIKMLPFTAIDEEQYSTYLLLI